MHTAAEAVMAVVHVKAPAELDPYVIEAELTRAICSCDRHSRIRKSERWTG